MTRSEIAGAEIDDRLAEIAARRPRLTAHTRVLVDLEAIDMTGEAALVKLQTAASRTGRLRLRALDIGDEHLLANVSYTGNVANGHKIATKISRWLDVPFDDVLVQRLHAPPLPDAF